jgi:hypothetical protein
MPMVAQLLRELPMLAIMLTVRTTILWSIFRGSGKPNPIDRKTDELHPHEVLDVKYSRVLIHYLQAPYTPIYLY